MLLSGSTEEQVDARSHLSADGSGANGWISGTDVTALERCGLAPISSVRFVFGEMCAATAETTSKNSDAIRKGCNIFRAFMMADKGN